MHSDGAEVEGGGITFWAEAEEQRSKSKSKATDKSVRSTQALTPKQLGEIAEAEFIAKAVGMGFVVAKPWGDSEPYDFIVNPKKSFVFWRVQVKSAHTIGADGGCSFRAHDHNQKSYTSEDIDALVAYARPMNAWYVMPVRVVEELKSLMLAGSSCLVSLAHRNDKPVGNDWGQTSDRGICGNTFFWR